MARFLIDVNLPRRFQAWATDDYVFVRDIDPTWSDRQIWNYALANELVIVSQDADFTDRALLETNAPRIVHIRIGNMRLREWRILITRLWPEVVAKIADFRMIVVYRDTIDCID